MKHFAGRMLAVVLCMLLCTTALAQAVSYTIELDAAEGIYQGPGVDYGYARRIGADGVFTIVEEAYDEYGNLWGRLKSGAGWVMLQERTQTAFRETPYTTALKAADAIYEGPGADYDYVKNVGVDGVYTIVEEALGRDGALWGRLKSGAGWVRLSGAVSAGAAASDYTISLGAWVPVFSAPGDEGEFTGLVGEDGVYTIVSEKVDSLGNVWGELKSGAGWVNLNYVRTAGNPPVTAYFAETVDLENADWCEYIVDDSEFMVRIAFRANERLNNVKFTSLSYGDTYAVDQTHYWIHWLETDSYFVAGVVFYGDMTTYGISFVDEAGEERYYAVSLSGMDGSVVLNEYVR